VKASSHCSFRCRCGYADLRSIAAFALLALAAWLGVQSAHAHGELVGDFRAFYCAGELARQHAFSYDPSALAPCESRPAPGFFTARDVSVPAPLPGYLVLAFIPLSLLPFPVAAVAWGLSLITASIAAIGVLSRLQWVRFDAGIALLAIPLGAVVLPPGELPAIALLGIALVIYGCRRDDTAARVAGLLLTFAEPQIAFGVAAVLLGRRGAWREIAGVLAALALLTLAAIGPAESLAYVRDVLPAHVASEVMRAQQYTLSWALAELGLATSIALWIGRIVYALALAFAVVLGRRTLGSGEACAAGAALALLAGPFVHLDHLLCALPAAFAVASVMPAAGVTAALLLALPLPVIFSEPLLVLAVPLVTFWYSRNAYAALGATCAAALFAAISAHTGFTFQGNHGAVNGWATYVANNNVATGSLIWIVKAPVWIGVAATALCATALTGRIQSGGGRGRVG
jgi:hypothetical protein